MSTNIYDKIMDNFYYPLPAPKIVFIQINIITTNFNILQTKRYVLTQFCNIYELNYNFKFLPVKKKKITLLKSPHIHKKTWRTYIIKTYKLKHTFTLNFEDKTKVKNIIPNMNTLLKTLSPNCNIKVIYKSQEY
jgi:hypothetical protein